MIILQWETQDMHATKTPFQCISKCDDIIIISDEAPSITHTSNADRQFILPLLCRVVPLLVIRLI